jgi:hypothetical protein
MAAASDGQAGRDDDRSKFEDMPRSVWFEMFKSAVLFVFQGAIVAGHRQESYLRLGFRKRPVMLGYDVVSGERLAGRHLRTGHRCRSPMKIVLCLRGAHGAQEKSVHLARCLCRLS